MTPRESMWLGMCRLLERVSTAADRGTARELGISRLRILGLE